MLLVWIALVVLSLRPVAPLEAGIERLLTPLRFVAELTWPLRLVGGRPARAQGDVRRELIEEASSRSALLALHDSVLPTRADLLEGRRLVRAEVVSRSERGRDRIVIRPWTFEGLEVGQPVVARDAYVGRVVQVDRARGRVTVDLVTDRSFFVGATLDSGARESTVHLVVGGLAVQSRRSGEPATWLAAHNPSGRPIAGRSVVVGELLPELDPHSALAAGFELGTLELGSSDDDWRVRPVLDYLHGLFQVVVLTHPRRGQLDPAPPLHPLEEGRWVRARALTAGDPSPWRSTVQLDRGRVHGVRAGAAVVAGARLVGRVATVGELGCEVALLDDPGLALTAVGRPVQGDSTPRVLGRLVALGPASDGALVYHWRDVTLPRVGDGPTPPPRRMRLFTGSGEAGLPAGLLIGIADMPSYSSEGEGHTVRLSDAASRVDELGRLWVRIDSGTATTRSSP
ncbi:Cell shape-determining protein MreC [Planctomycetes bacterium Pla86]|uniref:Cell shape-determining protein MreC n=2 Tax=Engelhardtia mirabilis TaxID=2528011 RepID=A0A518BPY2_9BACT|nr:Cell shape-determining protein MreC [Planctomycetes bacterium Pla133]QDV03356.1 Cell shape-determining protein MreC [Planctomycetes bacterium Pla86]